MKNLGAELKTNEEKKLSDALEVANSPKKKGERHRTQHLREFYGDLRRRNPAAFLVTALACSRTRLGDDSRLRAEILSLLGKLRFPLHIKQLASTHIPKNSRVKNTGPPTVAAREDTRFAAAESSAIRNTEPLGGDTEPGDTLAAAESSVIGNTRPPDVLPAENTEPTLLEDTFAAAQTAIDPEAIWVVTYSPQILIDLIEVDRTDISFSWDDHSGNFRSQPIAYTDAGGLFITIHMSGVFMRSICSSPGAEVSLPYTLLSQQFQNNGVLVTSVIYLQNPYTTAWIRDGLKIVLPIGTIFQSRYNRGVTYQSLSAMLAMF